ncbi:polysaccharide deacetylase family protein [Pseudoalteromonas piscicida]
MKYRYSAWIVALLLSISGCNSDSKTVIELPVEGGQGDNTSTDNNGTNTDNSSDTDNSDKDNTNTDDSNSDNANSNNPTKETKEEVIKRILSAQGAESTTSLALKDFEIAEFGCVTEANLSVIQGYFNTTQDELQLAALKHRLCKVVELFELNSKSLLTPNRLKEVGLRGLFFEDGKLDEWAYDELILTIPESHFEYAALQGAVEDFHHNQSSVWPKQINISFDDGGALNSIHDHLDLFDKYNATFTYYVSHYSTIDHSKVADIENRGHEIGHHGVIHRHAKIYSEENGVQKWIADDITPQLDAMRRDGLTVTSYAYPFGAYTKETDREIKKYFTHVRKFASWSSVIYRGERSDRPITTGLSMDSHRFDLDKIQNAIDTLKGGETLYLATHVIGKTGNEWYITPENLENVLAYASAKGLKFCHTSECMNFKGNTTN